MSRLKSIRTVLNYFHLVYSQNIIYLTSEDKFRIVLNLKSNNLFVNPQTEFTLKRTSGFSTSSNLHNLFYNSSSCLWNLAILPFTEKISNKFAFKYRPFRSSKSEFFVLKKFFLSKNNFFYLNLKAKFIITSQSRQWILKNFPNKSNSLQTWLCNLNYIPLKNTSLRFDFSNLSYTFFNYLFSNLV
jgi:hypothetical protein